MNNLNLPICPKCNDTKFVKQERSIKMFVILYKCEKCNISWSTIDYLVQ